MSTCPTPYQNPVPDHPLMLAYHQRSDHGRDGTPLDGHACNCRALFAEYEREVLGRGEGERP